MRDELKEPEFEMNLKFRLTIGQLLLLGGAVSGALSALAHWAK
jgi:hypothetical protein